MSIHRDSQNCSCAGCQAARLEGYSNSTIMDIVGTILRHGGKIIDDTKTRKSGDVKIIKVESHKKLEKDSSDLYTAMMDDAGIPIDQRA